MEHIRKCVGCSSVKNREYMIRLLKDFKTGEIVINPDTKSFGRSIYICKSKECIENAFSKKKIQKCIKSNLDKDLLSVFRLECLNKVN